MSPSRKENHYPLWSGQIKSAVNVLPICLIESCSD